MNAALMTAPYGTLSLQDRKAALGAARRAGREAATGPVDPRDLEAPRPREYYLHIIVPLLERGIVNEKNAAGWKLKCLDHRALEDPRVQAFLFGWHEHALELLEGEESIDDVVEAELREVLERAAAGD